MAGQNIPADENPTINSIKKATNVISQVIDKNQVSFEKNKILFESKTE